MNEAEFERAVELAGVYREEARRCAETGCYLAACVMIVAALEAGLLAMVVSFEEELRAQDAWPESERRPPIDWHLPTLISTATKAGWLPTLDVEDTEDVDMWAEGEVGDVVEFVNTVRKLAAHPGAYVRDSLDIELGGGHYRASFEITGAVFDHLHAALMESLRRETAGPIPGRVSRRRSRGQQTAG